jgi:hypothetical protein
VDLRDSIIEDFPEVSRYFIEHSLNRMYYTFVVSNVFEIASGVPNK